MLIITILLTLIYYISFLYAVLIITYGISSLVKVDKKNQFYIVLNLLIAPPCNLLKKRFPSLVIDKADQKIDLSPLVLLVLLGCIMLIIQKIALSYNILI